MKLQSDRYKTGEKALSRAEYEKLKAVITDTQDELLIKLTIATGIRREDICNIKCNDLNLKDGKLTFWEAKKNRLRTIDLPEGIIVLVKKFYNSIDRRDLKKREYLFDMVGRTAYRHFNYWCKVAGIPERPFHALRATCIKFAHESGWSDEQISKLTGDTIATIQEHYMVPSVGEMSEVTNSKPII